MAFCIKTFLLLFVCGTMFEVSYTYPSSGTQLWIAAQRGDLENVKNELKKVYIDEPDQNGWTALHHASYYGQGDIVAYLIENKAKVNQKTTEGRTPIYIAAKNHQIHVAQILLQNGANPRIERNVGYSACSYKSHMVHVLDEKCHCCTKYNCEKCKN